MRLDAKELLMYILLFLITLFFLFGCRSKQISNSTSVQKDSIISVSVKYVSNPIQTRLNFPDLCDSTGVARSFSKIETSGGNKAKIIVSNNQLTIDMETGQSESKSENNYVNQQSEKNQSTEIVKFRTPWWMWKVLIFSIILNLLLLYILFFK